MFTGTPAQLREREQRARNLAQQVASLLNQVQREVDCGKCLGTGKA